ncbi:formyl peptide receptor 2-like [Leptodactylus fuscus]
MSLTCTLLCLLRSITYVMSILQKISVTLYGIIFVLGIIGNGLVIWIAGFRMKKTISAVWFLHLAIADFLCCMSIPLRILFEVNYISDLYINTYCISIISLFNLNTSASILLLTAMSIDRCVSIMWPFWAKVHRTRRLVRITAGGIWGLSLPLTALVLHLNDWCRLSTYYSDYMRLTTIIIGTVRLLLMFVIPFLIILTSYVIIFVKIRKRKRPQRSQRPYRIITAVILCFFICWSPHYICALIPLENGSYKKIFLVHFITTILAYLNSCMNPIIYVLMGQDIKLGFLRSIPNRVEKALSDHPDDLCREPEDGELQ